MYLAAGIVLLNYFWRTQRGQGVRKLGMLCAIWCVASAAAAAAAVVLE